MRTGKVSKALGIDQKTITNWLNRDELKDLFSVGAQMESGKSQRDFNMDDQLILNTIRHFRTDQGEDDWEKIAAEVRSGFRQTEMPDSFYTTETTTSMQVYTQMIEIKNQLDLITIERDQLRTELEKERGRSQTQLDKEREKSQTQLDKQVEDRRRVESELNREIGKLLGRLETLQGIQNEEE
jgi:hypothetical protein